MSKLIITSTTNGTIRYIEGEEVEISIEGVKDRISAIEKKLVEGETQFNSKVTQIRNEGADRIRKRKSQLDVEIDAANKRYNSEVEAINKEIENRVSQETLAHSKNKERREALEKEKVKLMAVLKSAPVQQSVQTVATPPQASTQAPAAKPVGQPRRIVF